MKKFLCIATLLLSGTIRASYVPPALNQLIIKADRILYGEIVCVDESVIEILEFGGIDHVPNRITISKFKEWNCGKRWADYQAGQMSVFFLRNREGTYHTMGGGNEGELPVHHLSVYVHGSTLREHALDVPFEPSDREMEDYGFNNPYNGYKLDFADFWEAVEVIKKCVKSGVSPSGTLLNPDYVCDPREYQPAAEANEILSWALSNQAG